MIEMQVVDDKDLHDNTFVNVPYGNVFEKDGKYYIKSILHTERGGGRADTGVLMQTGEVVTFKSSDSVRTPCKTKLVVNCQEEMLCR
jgi:hypothetical protein